MTHKVMQYYIYVLLFVTTISCSNKEEQIQSIFDKHQAQGTFVLKSLSTQELLIHNQERSKTRFSPASTFKILNTMIALQNRGSY